MTAEQTRRRCVVRFANELLVQMLHLPEGHRLIAVRDHGAFSDETEMLFEGPSIPETGIGFVTPQMLITYTAHETDELVRRREITAAFTPVPQDNFEPLGALTRYRRAAAEDAIAALYEAQS